MKEVDMLGYLGGMFLTINLIPQIYKTKKSETAKDISLLFLLMNEMGLLMYSIYGFTEKLYPMAIPSFISFKLNTMLLLLKIKYDYMKSSKTIMNEVTNEPSSV